MITDQQVYSIILTAARRGDKHAPTHKSMAEQLNCSKKAVELAIESLIVKGDLEKARITGGLRVRYSIPKHNISVPNWATITKDAAQPTHEQRRIALARATGCKPSEILLGDQAEPKNWKST